MAAPRDQVITVSMTLNSKGFEQGLVLSDKQAKTMGKSIANALTIDSRSATTALKNIGIEKDKLMANFIKLKKVINDTLSIGSAQSKASIDKIKELSTTLKSVESNSTRAAKALREVKFTIGQTNKNIKSVTDRLIKLEEVAKRIGNMHITVTTGGSVQGMGGGTSGSRVMYGPTSRPQFTYTPEQRAYSGAGPSRPDATELSRWADRTQARAAGVATTQAKSVFMSKDFLQNAEKAGELSAKSFEKGFKKISSLIEKQGNSAFSSFSRVFGANFLADALVNSFQGLFRTLEGLTFETAKYAARTEELGVVLTSLARINNISTQTLVEQEVAVKRLNITTQDARETLARFINVGFDLEKAGPLARVAQDLAVIEGLNTSEELDKLIIGIQTLQSRNLRSAGVYMTVDEVLDRLAATTGRARDSFSTLEKQTAVLNDVLAYGARAAGTYDEAMTTASKQFRSLPRLFFEAQNALGKGLIPAFKVFVDVSATVLKTVTLMPNAFTGLLTTIGMLTASLVLLKTTAVQTLAVGLGGFITGASKSLVASVKGKSMPVSAEQLETNKQLRIQQAQLLSQRKLHAEKLRHWKTEKDIVNQLQKQQLTESEILRLRKARTNYARTEKLLAEDNRRLNQIQGTIDRGGVSRTDAFVAGIGKVAVIGTAVTAIYQAASAVKEYRNSLYQLSAVDMTAVTKYSEDLKRISEDAATLNNLSNLEGREGLEIISRLSGLSRTKLDLDYRTLETNKSITEQLREQVKLRLEEERGDAERRLEDKRRDALTEIRKTQYNVSAQVENRRLMNEARDILLARFPGAKGLSEKQIGAGSNLRYLEQASAGAIASTFAQESEGASWKRFAQTSNLSVEAASVALRALDDTASATGKITDEQFAAREQAIKDYLEISLTLGDTQEEILAPFNTSLGYTAEQVAQVTSELQRLQRVAKEQELKDILKFVGDPTQNVFNTFQQQFDKQRASREKSIRDSLETLNKDRKSSGQGEWSKQELEQRLAQQLQIGDISFLVGQQGREAFKALESQVAQQLFLDSKTGKLSSPMEIIISNLQRLYGQDGKQGNLTGKGADLKGAIEGMRKQAIFQQEAEDAMSEFLAGSLTDLASSKLRKVLRQPVSESIGAFSIEKFTKGMENFVQQAMELGESSENIQKTRTRLANLFSTDSTKAQEEIRQLNALLAERNKLREAQEGLRDANNIEIQRLKNAVAIVQAETELAELKQRLTLPYLNSQYLAEKGILNLVHERREAEQQLTADIAIEIDKRNRYSLDSAREISRISAEVFRDAQRKESETQEEALKNVFGLALQTGNTGVFSDNPFIKEAVKQAELLGEIDKKGNTQLSKLDESNKIATDQRNIAIRANELLTSLGNTFNEGINTLSENISKSMNPTYSGTVEGFDRIFRAFSGQESGNNFRAVNSRTGATGLLQILPKYFQSYANIAGMPNTSFKQYKNDPNTNRELGYRALQNLYNQALQMSGGDEQLAVRMLASRWYTGSFNNYNSTRIPAPGEPSPMQYSNSILKRATGIGRLPTQSVIDTIKNQPVTSKTTGPTRVTYDEYAKNLGLTPEEYNKLIQISKITSADEARTAFSSAAILKQFGGNAFAQGPEAQAIGDFAKEIKDKISAQEVEKAMIGVRKLNASLITQLETTALITAYNKELADFDLGLTSATQRTELDIIKKRTAALEDSGSSESNKVNAEVEISRAQKLYDLRAETIKLINEEQYRATQTSTYRMEQERKFYNEQKSNSQELEDREEALNIRIREARSETSQYTLNLLREEILARKEAREEVEAQIRAERRTLESYTGTAQQRTDIERQALADRLRQHNETVSNIIRLETDLVHVREGMELRLLQRQKEINLERAQEYEDTLKRQLEAENEYRRISEEFDSDDFRTRALEKINSSMKSSTEMISDLFSDTFDSISDGFGGLVDRMTEKWGIFGGAAGNLLKGIFNNILGNISKNIIDSIAPTNPEVAAILGGTGSSTDKALQEQQNLLLASSTGLIGATNNLITVNNSTAMSSAVLGKTFGSVAGALLAILGVLQERMNVVMSITPQGGTATGGSTAGGGTQIGAIINAVTQGQANIGAISGGISMPSAASVITGPGSSGIVDAALSRIPTGGGAVGTIAGQGKGILSSLLSGKGLKGIGTSLLAGAPMLGMGLGGMLGGGSGLGGALGQAGGLAAGVALMGLLAPTALTGLIGSTFGLGLGASLAAASAATVVGLIAAPALLLGGWLLGRNKRRKEEEKVRNQAMLDTLPALQELLKQVKTDKIDGSEALSRADEIRKQYVEQMNQLKDSKTRKHALQDVKRLDAVIAEIKVAATAQTRRRELDDKIVPTYATGGVSNSSLIRVSQGESLFVPNGEGNVHAMHMVGAGIPGFAGGGMYTGVKVRGSFDGRDNILAKVPKGTVIANPRQASKIRQSRGYATGGVLGRSASFTAQGGIVVQPPSVTAIIVFSQEQAEKIGRQIPGAVIISKFRDDINQNGKKGIVGDIYNEFVK